MGHTLSAWRARSLHGLIFLENRRENTIFCVKGGLKIIIILLLPKNLSAAFLQLQATMTLLRHLLLGHAGKC